MPPFKVQHDTDLKIPVVIKEGTLRMLRQTWRRNLQTIFILLRLQSQMAVAPQATVCGEPAEKLRVATMTRR